MEDIQFVYVLNTREFKPLGEAGSNGLHYGTLDNCAIKKFNDILKAGAKVISATPILKRGDYKDVPETEGIIYVLEVSSLAYDFLKLQLTQKE